MMQVGPPRLSIALISGVVLAYEISLMRALSIIHWHHFAYMVISLALLGFGASGTFVMLMQGRLAERFTTLYILNAALMGISVVGCFMLAQHVPFDALQMLWAPGQWGWLALIYILLATPFFFGANCICLALTRFPERIPAIYAFDLCGAGIGALGVVLLLTAVKPTAVLDVLGMLGVLAALLATLENGSRQRRRQIGLLALIAVLAFTQPVQRSGLRISEFKPLSQQLLIPDSRIVSEHASALGRLTVVESGRVPLRHAPGVSLNNTALIPEQLGVYVDGGGPHALTRYRGGPAEIRFVDQLTSSLPYHLVEPGNVLLLDVGTGMGILQAAWHGVGHIDAVEPNARQIELLTRDHEAFSGWPHLRDRTRIHATTARAFVARSNERYDVIQSGLPNTVTTSAAGALNTNYGYTIEAMRGYIEHLQPDGLLAVTVPVQIPPRRSLKLLASAIDAIQAVGNIDAAKRVVIIRGWNTVTLVFKNGLINDEEIVALRTFCDARSFDVVYYPGILSREANRFNILQRPYFHTGATALLGPNRAEFIERYKFDIRAATDDRPYFALSSRLSTLGELLSTRDRGGLPLIDWAYPVLIATLIQAVLMCALLILAPLALLTKAGNSRPGIGRLPVSIYFAAIGLAFLFIEIALIQKFVMFLGHPVYAVALVLTGLLVYAGLGSRCSQYFGKSAVNAVRLLPFMIIAAVAFAYGLILPALLDALIVLDIWLRFVVALVLLAPLGFFMGMPFPLGLARLSAAAPRYIPWAWAINGSASVVSAVLATIIAVHFGFSTVVMAAVALYLLAAWGGLLRT